MNRKMFLKRSALTVLGMSMVGSVVKAEDGKFSGDCKTTSDILGPFYRPDAPVRSDLTSPDLAGNRITVKGRVFAGDCETPLTNAKVEIWHCDSEGNYDNDSKDFNQRAQQMSTDQGVYSFYTIFPGKYLNGKEYRPAHIHFRVTAKGHQELVSQLYFKGDPHIASDKWASDKNAELRIKEIIPEDVNGDLSLNFDIYLAYS